ILVAIIQPPKVFDLVIFAFGTMGNSFMVPYIAAVYSKKANSAGVLCSMIGGGVTNILWTAFDWQAFTGFHPFLAGLLVSIIGMIVGTYFGKPPTPDMEEVFEKAKGPRNLPKKVEKNIAQDIAPEASVIADFMKYKPGAE